MTRISLSRLTIAVAISIASCAASAASAAPDQRIAAQQKQPLLDSLTQFVGIAPPRPSR